MLAIAAAATDSDDNRRLLRAWFVGASLLCAAGAVQSTTRQRLQRVVVMAMSELANGFESFKETLRRSNGVPMLLSFLTPSHDEYLIKETLQLLGRMTQNCWSIQQELQKHSAIDKYAHLLFAELHDTQISELAALALVNLCSEVPSCLRTIEALPRYNVIRSSCSLQWHERYPRPCSAMTQLDVAQRLERLPILRIGRSWQVGGRQCGRR